ncbi:glycerol-3-phosphate dehydrogenase (NAD(+)) [Sarracenia purpurea var. burkii]
MAPSLESQQLQLDGSETPSDNHIADDEVPNKSRVTVVGSGNWGSVAAKLIASNTLKLASFHDEVRMWVFEEVLPGGEKLSEVINQTNVIPTS